MLDDPHPVQYAEYRYCNLRHDRSYGTLRSAMGFATPSHTFYDYRTLPATKRYGRDCKSHPAVGGFGASPYKFRSGRVWNPPLLEVITSLNEIRAQWQGMVVKPLEVVDVVYAH